MVNYNLFQNSKFFISDATLAKNKNNNKRMTKEKKDDTEQTRGNDTFCIHKRIKV